MNWILKHCLIKTMMLIFRTRGSRIAGSFRLHYLSISRQVHSCIPFDVFLSKYLQSYLYVPFTCIKKKKYFWMMWYILLVGGGTMVRWIGMVIHRMGRYISLGINNPCSSDPFAVVKASTHGLCMGGVSQKLLSS